jgi:hypothetical protein
MVGASKNSSTRLVSVDGMQTGTTSVLIVDVSTTNSMATTGLLRSSQFATDTLPSAGLNAAKGTLNYSGKLGTVHVTVTGGRSISMSQAVRCINPSANKADLGKTVSMQITDGTVSGSANLMLCSAIKTTFGSGDIGLLMVIKPGTGTGPSFSGTPVPALTPPPGVTPPAGVTPPTTSGGLQGAINIGNFPAITAISPAPGTPMSTTPTITVTFASAVPAGAQVNMILMPSAGGMPVQLTPQVSGNTITATVTTALAAGTYKLIVSATNGSGGSSIYQGSYTVS